MTSARGHKSLFVMCDFDSNYIDAEPIKNHTDPELPRAWERCYESFRRAGFHAVLQRIDNEVSKKIIAHAEKNGIEMEVVAPGNHRTNPAERAIQTLKGHVISIISGPDPDFPLDQWDLLVP